jgi:hypothetical protein
MQSRKPIWIPKNYLSQFNDYLVVPIRNHLRRRHWFFNLVQLSGIVLAVYWWRELPVPGYAIGVLAVLAAVMSVHGEMRSGHKVLWMLLIGAFLFLEFRAITKDRGDFARDETSRRQQENDKFKAIADGLVASIQQSQIQFAATMSRTQAMLRKEQKITETTNKSLDQLTGGGQFCYLMAIEPVRLNDGRLAFQLAKMNSGPLPLDVCHVLIHEDFPPKSAADAARLMNVIVDRQLGPLPPGKVSGTQGTLGFSTDIILPEGSYYIQINTRNNRFYENLAIHPNVKDKGLEDIEVRDQKYNLVYSEPAPKQPK